MEMIPAIIERVMWWRKSQRKRDSRELIVLLDKDSCERFDRLKTKIPTFNNNKVIASALLCLEHKTDRIYRRQITKRIRKLGNEGHSPQQIADYLKKTGIPALAGMDKWDSETISSLSKTETGNLVNRAKNLQLRNHQP
ncbi:MAG: hypothetical protein L6406_25790 [Desulfobacterales bacterium]|nr:hypothetical protein [Desulfobacterales bacterium]